MHTIKITPNLLFEYQCTSGRFIRLPNRIESKLFWPELECSIAHLSAKLQRSEIIRTIGTAPWWVSLSMHLWRRLFVASVSKMTLFIKLEVHCRQKRTKLEPQIASSKILCNLCTGVCSFEIMVFKIRERTDIQTRWSQYFAALLWVRALSERMRVYMGVSAYTSGDMTSHNLWSRYDRFLWVNTA